MPSTIRDGDIVRHTDKTQQTYPWCKLFCDKETDPEGRTYYFQNLQTGETRSDEPEEGFWLWNYNTSTVHVAGLQETTAKDKRMIAYDIATSQAC